MKRDPGYYDYLPYNKRPKIEWPNGARVAFWVAPNIEFYELEPPKNPTRASWPRPVPDVLGYSYRDYGNRAGFQRMMEAMERCGVRGSVSLNVAMCEHHPEIIKACAERGWEFYSHGTYNTRYTFGMSEAQERALIQDSIDTIRKHTGPEARRLARARAHLYREHLRPGRRDGPHLCLRPVPRRPARPGEGAQGPPHQHPLFAGDERRHRLQRELGDAAPLRARSSSASSTGCTRKARNPAP